ncbi:MAG TPA: RNA polymerase factor sigma-54 [Dongiaceae bacterium]|jgi:RNA polymerase sigma-54 factor|nr:RNA polymerase factor sigma-54 [Dongiaceae bacterium]
MLRSRLGQQAVTRIATGLTPAQQQSIKLLGLTNGELADLLAEALAENPLLEPAADLPEAARARLRSPPSKVPRLPPAPRPLPAALGRLFAAPARRRPGAGGEAAADTAAAGPSLQEHLTTQLGTDLPDPADRAIGGALVEAVDEAGYLTQEPAEIAGRLRIDPARVARVLKRLQEFDPPGVFARSLSECLALQLADRGRLDRPMERLLERLDLLAEGKREALRRHCAVEAPRLDAMIAELRRLDPRPGLAFERSAAQAVTPDLTIERNAAGGWEVDLNGDSLPRLALNERYPDSGDIEARAYLRAQRSAAQWLLRALDRRADTLRRVAEIIVQRQAGFLEGGAGALKPLSRREIARSLGLHESTVSRAISGKHVATPRGVVALSAFFGGGLGEAADVAPAAARARLKEIVEKEPRGHPLSDQEIVRRLGQGGIALSRRTVAKYREMLKIPPSHRRRRMASL